MKGLVVFFAFALSVVVGTVGEERKHVSTVLEKIFSVQSTWKLAGSEQMTKEAIFADVREGPGIWEPVPVPHQIFHVTFNAGGRTVRIGFFGGHLAHSCDEHVQFDLDEGVFAGGSFVVRSEGDSLIGELFIFGSGVPIAVSLRGPLIAH